MAAAEAAMFDDVVVSNNKDLVKQLFLWSRELREAAKMEEKNQGSISRQLKRFKSTLDQMKFTFPNNDKLVNEIITDLVRKFETKWNEETRRQIDMNKRAREILLRWGSFSKAYVEKAELLCDNNDHVKTRKSWIVLSLLVGLVAPIIGTLPFVITIEQDGEDPSRDRLMTSAVWFGCTLW